MNSHHVNVHDVIAALKEARLCTCDDVVELGSGEQFVFVIQDAYFLDCQKMMICMLRLMAHCGVKVVCEEGYEGRLPSEEYFGFIDDPETKRKVAAQLVCVLRLGAAEFCDVIQDPPMEVWGVDNSAYHKEATASYRVAFNTSQQWRVWLAETLIALTEQCVHRLSEGFRQFLNDHPRNGISSRSGIGSDDQFTLLAELLVLEKYGKKLGIADDHLPGISHHVAASLKPSFDMESIADLDMGRMVTQVAICHGQILERLSETEADRCFAAILSKLELFYILLGLGCTAHDMAAIRHLDPSVDLLCDEAEAFLGHTMVLGQMRRERAAFAEAHSAARCFYKSLMRRTSEMMKGLFRVMSERGVDAQCVALVAGGAHQDTIFTELTERQVSHVFLTPKFIVKAQEQEHYVGLQVGKYGGTGDGDQDAETQMLQSVENRVRERFLRDIDGWRKGWHESFAEYFELSIKLSSIIKSEKYEEAAQIKNHIDAITSDVESNGTPLESLSFHVLRDLIAVSCVCLPVKREIVKTWARCRDSEAAETVRAQVAFIRDVFETLEEWRFRGEVDQYAEISDESTLLAKLLGACGLRGKEQFGMGADSWEAFREGAPTEPALRLFCLANQYSLALPKNVDDLFTIAESLRGIELEAEAIDLMNRFITEDGGSVDFDCLFDLDGPDTVEENAFTACQNANGLWMRREIDDAEQQFQQAIEMAPGHAHAHYQYAFFLQNERADFARALEHFKIAARLKPTDGLTPCTLGTLSLVMGDYEEAESALQTAWDLNRPNQNRAAARTLLARAVLAERRNEDTSIFLGQLRSLFESGIECMESTNKHFKALIDNDVKEPYRELFDAIFAAINSQDRIQALAALEQWKSKPQVSLETPWPSK